MEDGSFSREFRSRSLVAVVSSFGPEQCRTEEDGEGEREGGRAVVKLFAGTRRDTPGTRTSRSGRSQQDEVFPTPVTPRKRISLAPREVSRLLAREKSLLSSLGGMIGTLREL